MKRSYQPSAISNQLKFRLLAAYDMKLIAES